MLQSFAEIVRHDKSLLALLSTSDRRASIGNVNLEVSDIGGICVKILTIETKNPKSYSRRIAWTILGYLLINLTNYFDIHVEILIEECQRFKLSLAKHSFSDIGPATNRTSDTKQASKKARGSKKRRTANDDNNNHKDEEEQNDRTRFDRFWEVPLALENDLNLLANLTKDACLVSAEQITLLDINLPSPIDTPYEEQLLNNGFGDDDGQPFLFDVNDAMDSQNAMVVDENMNNVLDIPDMPAIPAMQGMDSQPIQSPIVNATQASNKEQSQHENAAALIAELSTLPSSSVAVEKKKRAASKRRATRDVETIIPSKIMKTRISNAFIGCQNLEKLRVRITDQLKPKTSDFFVDSAIKGWVNRDQFARGRKTRPEPNDWTIIDDVFGLNDHAADESAASDVLQSEHGSQFSRTRSQRANMSFNEQSSFDATLMPPPPITSTPHATPQRPRRFDRSSISRAPSPSNLSNLFTPPSPFQSSAQHPNSPSRVVPPPVEYGDDGDGISVCCFNQSNDEQQTGLQNVSLLQATNDQTKTTIVAAAATATMDEEFDESEGDPVENTDLKTMLGESSTEYTIITKLIRLWQKDVHPIKVERLLKKGCNRLQAAKTFSALLVLKKKSLVQMENAHDGKITHISAGPKITLPA